MLIENPLNSSPLIFPVLECFHLLGFAVSVGTIAIVDFSILGFGMRHQTPARLSRDFALWTGGALIVVLFSGLMLFSSDPDMYYLNPAFDIKVPIFLLAVIFNYTIRRKVVAASASPGRSKLVACVSLALWMGVVFGGIFIGFTCQIKGF